MVPIEEVQARTSIHASQSSNDLVLKSRLFLCPQNRVPLGCYHFSSFFLLEGPFQIGVWQPQKERKVKSNSINGGDLLFYTVFVSEVYYLYSIYTPKLDGKWEDDHDLWVPVFMKFGQEWDPHQFTFQVFCFLLYHMEPSGNESKPLKLPIWVGEF